MNQYLELEKRLAELLGCEKPQALTTDGSRRYNEPRVVGFHKDTGRRIVYPMWCRDKAAAFALMVEHDLQVDVLEDIVGVEAHRGIILYEPYTDHPDKETAVRVAIVKAVINKLESQA